jgi:hypothetical protein
LSRIELPHSRTDHFVQSKPNKLDRETGKFNKTWTPVALMGLIRPLSQSPFLVPLPICSNFLPKINRISGSFVFDAGFAHLLFFD